VNKDANKQVYCQLLSRCCKELTAAQIKALPAHLRAVIEPKFEAFQEKKRMSVFPAVSIMMMHLTREHVAIE